MVDTSQIWVNGNWIDRFGVRPNAADTGYGHTAEQMRAVLPRSATDLAEYDAAVNDRTRVFLDGVTATDLDRVVDQACDPPVTLGVRLISVAVDSLQHLGQAVYLRGLL